jgi:glycosyltransferase involved in cell wall biosynthesis
LAVTGASKESRSDLFEELPEVAGEHLIHIGHVQGRREYGKLLAAADIVLSTARHEFFGISVLEAAYAGAFPLLPKRLSYPEILSPHRFRECYYTSEADLFGKAERLLTGGVPSPEPIRRGIAAHDWRRAIDRFDRFFSDAMASGRSPRP